MDDLPPRENPLSQENWGEGMIWAPALDQGQVCHPAVLLQYQAMSEGTHVHLKGEERPLSPLFFPVDDLHVACEDVCHGEGHLDGDDNGVLSLFGGHGGGGHLHGLPHLNGVQDAQVEVWFVGFAQEPVEGRSHTLH